MGEYIGSACNGVFCVDLLGADHAFYGTVVVFVLQHHHVNVEYLGV